MKGTKMLIFNVILPVIFAGMLALGAALEVSDV
jgi:hypothetical protein